MICNALKIFILITILTGCGGGESPKVTSPDPIPQSALKYFGFAAIDCNFDDPTDTELKTNYLDEVIGFTNIAQMCVFNPNEHINERLANFKLANISAILHVESILFEHNIDSTTHSGSKITLRGDAEMRWENFVELNKTVLNSTYIAAIYVVDEPVWNGLSYSDFSEGLHIIKTALPTIPTMMIEAFPVVDQAMVTDELDWLGFDRYDTVDPEKDSAWLSDLAVMVAAKTRSDQKIIITASTQWLPYYSDANIQPEDMEKVANSYYNVANSHADVIALIGYLWPSGFDDPEQLGARNLPENVQKSLREIGNKIITK
jgi:hypothetical protein